MKKIELYEDDVKKARAMWLGAERDAEDAKAEFYDYLKNGNDDIEKRLLLGVFQQKHYTASAMRAMLKALDLLEDPFVEWVECGELEVDE